jgi:anti-sigma B factor antagonist
MQIDERADGDVRVLELKGKVTLFEGYELTDRVNSLVNLGHKRIFLNLAAVTYVDSGGLGEIGRSYRTVSRQGGSLKLLNLTERVKQLLSITKLTYLEGSEGDGEAGVGSHLKPRAPSDRQTMSLPIPSSDAESD